ncbi:MAG: diguanylate cyclase domain-containing protein [Ruminococcus sp.]
MKKKIGKLRWQKSWGVTIGVILLVILASYFTIRWINDREEEKCFETLYEEADELAANIEMYADNDREQLEMLADIAAGYEDLTNEQLWNMLDAHGSVGMMSRIEILLPDNTVILEGGEKVNAEGVLSFDEEAAKGIHITNREMDVVNSDEYIVRNYVPVVRNGSTAAMLYGVIELGKLPEEIQAKPYGGKAAIYIIEGETGDFLVDTWHNEAGGNIWELGERKMASGYDHDQLKQGLIDGESGYVVFVSESIGQYLYFYYTPMAINDWRLALSVPEDVVFEGAGTIRNVLNIFMVFEGLCFFLYFLWMLRHIRREINEKQRQMNILNYIYDVQSSLFGAHESQENIIMALEKVGQMTSAQKTGFWIRESSDKLTTFTWTAKDESHADECCDDGIVRRLLQYFDETSVQFEASNERELREKLPGCRFDGMKNLIAIPVEYLNGGICGVLTGENLKHVQDGLVLLKNVSFSFSMLAQNVYSYNAIKEQGETDILTGLHNRNKFELDLLENQEKFSSNTACIYIDANGLHELNNEHGHEAGDRMLQTVADQIRKMFGSRYAYRIGGDEFLAFVQGLDEVTVSYRLKKAEENLKEAGIYISAGVQWTDGVSSIHEVIKEAEKKMYRAKEKFYEEGVFGREQVR